MESISSRKVLILTKFYHAYDNYMTYAFPHDELKPLAKTFTDSLVKLGNLKPCYHWGTTQNLKWAVLRLSENLTFDVDARIHLFESNIRVLGGLVSAHILATDSTNSVNVWEFCIRILCGTHAILTFGGSWVKNLSSLKLMGLKRMHYRGRFSAWELLFQHVQMSVNFLVSFHDKNWQNVYLNLCCYFSIILASDQQRRLEQPCQPAAFLFTVVGTTGFLGVLLGLLGTMVPGIKTGRRKRATSGNVLSTSEACARRLAPMAFSMRRNHRMIHKA
ncbi:Alpha-mannosidase I MNS5 [Camellia lanceoleosa]|uniref:Alpha-mannosidase I MNS5 n=1 Tax=Camellia lanceoleosa TaxID=1840588 RepID=A0ACC0FQG7_9ERIC|nr:Alpha-mannosidase I MNS5 [Camellia lanceoleosa]